MEFYVRYRQRIVDNITGKLDPSVQMNRPHIRFDPTTLNELSEDWAHAQNDALGYFLWIYTKLVRAGLIEPGDKEIGALADLSHYLKAIKFWQDEDAGHWEEVRKIAASSIGPVTAAMQQLRGLITESPQMLAAFEQAERPLTAKILDELIKKGEDALTAILPHECIQADPLQRRDHDGALLFLIYPLEVVSSDMARRITDNVSEHLQGDFGVRRYNGDSYWCADYKKLLPAETRTTDFSEDMSGRDSLLKSGQEAQWCIFDPIMSIAAGMRFLQSKAVDDLREQRAYLRRSLSQITSPTSRFGPYRCPESYYMEDGQFVPNDLTPLLWTQANLALALHWMKQSLASQ